jgi:predicted Fe-Mo cluster-binding NifX family protein
VEEGRETHREERRLVKTELSARAAELRRYGVDLLICGAISAQLQFRIVAAGIQVIPFLCGPVDEVLDAYLNDRLARRAFAMPGFQRQHSAAFEPRDRRRRNTNLK